MGRVRTKFVGVYQRESSTRRHAGKPDVGFDITYTDAAGKKVWEKIGWRSEGYSAASASHIRGERIRALRHGQELPKRRSCPTLAEAWARYDAQCLPELKSARDTRSRYHLYLEPALGSKPLDAISVLDVEALKSSLTKAGSAPATVKHVLAILRRIYRQMQQWELYAGRIPTASVKMPTLDNARLRYLTAREAQMLLDALCERSPKWARIALVSLHTGARLGEVLALRARDVDLRGGVAHVLDAKTGTRPVFLTDTVAAALARIMPSDPAGLLFEARGGGMSHEASDTFSRVVEEWGFNAGIDDRRQKVVFHTLRHTFGSWAAQRGVPLYVIAELMGHSTLEITKRYSHLAPDQKRQAIRLIEDTFRHGP